MLVHIIKIFRFHWYVGLISFIIKISGLSLRSFGSRIQIFFIWLLLMILQLSPSIIIVIHAFNNVIKSQSLIINLSWPLCISKLCVWISTFKFCCHVLFIETMLIWVLAEVSVIKLLQKLSVAISLECWISEFIRFLKL
jgi:hypothetical protein